MRYDSPLAVFALLVWCAITGMQLHGARLVREPERSYAPAYKWLKNVVGAVGVLAVVARFTGITGTAAYTVMFLGGLLVASLVEYRHIRRRNADTGYMTVRTRRGLASLSDRDEAQLILSEAAGIIRHQRLDGREYVDEAGIIEVRDALGLPSADEFEAAFRAEMAARRARLARDAILAADVDLLLREMRKGATGDRGA